MLGVHVFNPLRSGNVPEALGRPPRENWDQNVAPCIAQALFPLMRAAQPPVASHGRVRNGWKNRLNHVVKELTSVHSVRRGWDGLTPGAEPLKGGFLSWSVLFP